MSADPYDPIYHIAESLSRIANELERIRVAEGPCNAETRVPDGWTTICALPAGHTGQHCDDGPFTDRSHDDPAVYGSHRWDA